MSKISEAWKSLGDDGKKPYNDAAAAAKAKYIEEHGEDALKRKKSKMKKKKKKDSAKKDTAAKDGEQNYVVALFVFPQYFLTAPHLLDKPSSGGKKQPPGDDLAHIPSKPAEGFPSGWITRLMPRKTGDKSDTYWFSPAKGYKFRSKAEVERFLKCLETADGDEDAAHELHLKDERAKRGSSSVKKPKSPVVVVNSSSPPSATATNCPNSPLVDRKVSSSTNKKDDSSSSSSSSDSSDSSSDSDSEEE